MIMLAVLGAISILLVLILNLSADSSFGAEYVFRMQQQDRAYYAAASAASTALESFEDQQPGGPHTLLDRWAMDPPPIRFNGFIVNVHIVDEERFLNPNHLVNKEGKDDADRVKVFRRLIFLLGQDEDLSNAVLDWVDADSNRHDPRGAESLDYEKRRAKNNPLDSIEEMASIMGFTADLMNGREYRQQQLPGLLELLSVHAGSLVNVNTAEPMVLRALVPDMDEATVQAIVERRRRQPFKSLEDMLEVAGVTQDEMYYLNKLGATKSETWRVEAIAASDNPADETRLRLRATYKRDKRGFRPLAWKVDELSASAGPSPTTAATGFPAAASPTLSPSPRGPGKR
ncbi:MAG: general secretion pathway protein GspK [Armatimonadetes bacterium]|nr:general secretion pathway protein GspK [Armatimonadota bacterium]